MPQLSSSEWRQLLIVLVNSSYHPFIIAYVSLWMFVIVQRILGAALD